MLDSADAEVDHTIPLHSMYVAVMCECVVRVCGVCVCVSASVVLVDVKLCVCVCVRCEAVCV